MTVRTNALQVCDRCQKPFNEKNLKAGDAVPTFKQKGLVVTETVGSNLEAEPKYNVLFAFDDMCPDCQTAVTNLLAKVRLDAPAGKKTGTGTPPGGPVIAKKRQRKTKETESTPAKTEEYAEKPAETPKAEEKTEAAAETKVEEKPAEENSAKGNGDAKVETSEASGSDDDSHLITDPETGDKYDPATGEVIEKGTGAASTHPF